MLRLLGVLLRVLHGLRRRQAGGRRNKASVRPYAGKQGDFPIRPGRSRCHHARMSKVMVLRNRNAALYFTGIVASGFVRRRCGRSPASG
ncbi:hypothetical protein ABZ611_26850 [Streptomyces sp. NPDC007861]|uniref:hypothetical protein n=1 Tax=Streptomyces sp. NPDC007861 TaxID=3154893 RepID=UPI003405FE08